MFSSIISSFLFSSCLWSWLSLCVLCCHHLVSWKEFRLFLSSYFAAPEERLKFVWTPYAGVKYLRAYQYPPHCSYTMCEGHSEIWIEMNWASWREIPIQATTVCKGYWGGMSILDSESRWSLMHVSPPSPHTDNWWEARISEDRAGKTEEHALRSGKDIQGVRKEAAEI